MRSAVIFCALGLLNAQPALKTKSADYPVHVQLESVTLAAEYLVHSLPTPRGTLVASDYLLVEVAFFGPPMSRLKMSPDQFTLKINGRGTPLLPQLPGLVASSIKFPSGHPSLTGTGSVGMGDGQVTVGPRAPASRFPGDGNDRTAPTLDPVRITQEKEEDEKIEYRVQNASLPEGERSLPRNGLIYFPWRGKIKNIHSLELMYEGPMGKTVLKLLP